MEWDRYPEGFKPLAVVEAANTTENTSARPAHPQGVKATRTAIHPFVGASHFRSLSWGVASAATTANRCRGQRCWKKLGDRSHAVAPAKGWIRFADKKREIARESGFPVLSPRFPSHEKSHDRWRSNYPKSLSIPIGRPSGHREAFSR